MQFIDEYNDIRGVTSIGSSAFSYCTALTSITIPEGVTSIGNSAFYNCTALTEINYNAVEVSNLYSGNYVFYCAEYDRSGITVTIGASVTKSYKLVEVYNLSALEITVGSTDNGYVAYYAKNVYTSTSDGSQLITQDGFEFVYDGENYYLIAYKGTDSNIALPTLIVNDEAVNYGIYDYAFYNNTKITSVTIPEGGGNINRQLCVLWMQFIDEYNDTRGSNLDRYLCVQWLLKAYKCDV